jgi:hypothetical protein
MVGPILRKVLGISLAAGFAQTVVGTAYACPLFVGVVEGETTTHGSIQAAVDDAAPGCVITVGAGVYSESVKLSGNQGVLLQGDPNAPLFSAVVSSGKARGIHLEDTVDTTVRNLTISGANEGAKSEPLFFQGNTRALASVINITNNGGGSDAGGVRFTKDNPGSRLENSQIWNNQKNGVVIAGRGSSSAAPIEIVNNTFFGNQRDAISIGERIERPGALRHPGPQQELGRDPRHQRPVRQRRIQRQRPGGELRGRRQPHDRRHRCLRVRVRRLQRGPPLHRALRGAGGGQLPPGLQLPGHRRR